jgi:hypothetical protein
LSEQSATSTLLAGLAGGAGRAADWSRQLVAQLVGVSIGDLSSAPVLHPTARRNAQLAA